MRLDRVSRLANLAAQLLLGATGLAFITLLCFRLGISLASTAFAYVILVTLLSPIGSLTGSVVLSIAAVACLNYFFTAPLFTFQVEYPQDILALAAFLANSLLVTALVARLRKTAEDAETSRLNLIDTIPALAWTALPDGSRDFHSRRWTEFSGLPVKHAEGQGWDAIIHPDDRPKVLEKWRYAVATGEPFEIEARERNAAGEYRALLIRAHPLRDSKGNIVKWYGICGDIDDLRRAAEALQKTQAQLAHVARVTALGELAASIAHEVSQPLTGVVSSGNACLRWLDGETPDLEAARRSIQRMISDGTRASEVITRIRAMVTKSTPRKERLDINDLVRDVIELVRSDVQQHGVSLRTELSDHLPLVGADRIQLQQVVLNLILNAGEAVRTVHDGPREVIVRSAADGPDNVLVSVDDSGPGLAPSKFEEVFQAFYTTKTDGMGMGLAVSRSIVEAHGGTLSARSNAPRGAKFQFSLPAADDRDASP